MRRMQRDESHSFPDPAEHAIHYRRINLAMRRMSPPNENVSRLKALFGKTMLRILQSRGANIEFASLGDAFRDRAMHPVRVNLAHNRVLLLVNVLAPDQDADLCCHSGQLHHSNRARKGALPDRSLFPQGFYRRMAGQFAHRGF